MAEFSLNVDEIKQDVETSLNVENNAFYGVLNNKLTLSKTSLLNGMQEANISSADITLNNNAKIGSMKDTFYVNHREDLTGYNWNYLSGKTDVNIGNSKT